MKKRCVGAFEAKTHLPKLLEAVLHGERITITRRGQNVAMLVPVQDVSKKSSKSVIADLRSWRKGIKWGKGLSTAIAREEGRK